MTNVQDAEAWEGGVALALVPLADVGSASGMSGMSQELVEAIAAWLDEKQGHSGSTQTFCAYRHTLLSYRTACQHIGLDLDGTDLRGFEVEGVVQDLANVAQA